MCDRLSIQCIIPPYINDKLAQSTDPSVRARAIANIRAAATLRTQRVMSQAMPGLMASLHPWTPFSSDWRPASPPGLSALETA